MKSYKMLTTVLVDVLLISLVSAAPLEMKEDEIKNKNETTPASTEIPETVRPAARIIEARTSKPEEESSSTELPDFTSFKNTSTFTCYGRVTGYYADVKLGCRVYHFCTQMDTIGETSYQRMSYICLEGSIFDQKDLNCVKESDLKVVCSKAEAEYESSNKQFDTREDSQPSMSDSLAANIMMNPITRFIAG